MMKSIFKMIVIILLISCNQSSEESNLNSTISNVEDTIYQKSNKIIIAYQNGKAANQEEKYQNDLIFIKEFPNSFEEMKEIFGFSSDKGAAPIYNQGQEIIEYYSNLELKEKEKKEYYDKYINICINGKWEADNIRAAFGIHKRILNDTESICKIMNERTDDELKTVFQFIFDGPHPKNKENERIKAELMDIIPDKYLRLKNLINKSYQELINENHNLDKVVDKLNDNIAKIQNNEVNLDALVPIDILNEKDINVYKKYGLEFTGNCYACDLAEFRFKNNKVSISNVCESQIELNFEILKLINTEKKIEIKTENYIFIFSRIEDEAIYKLETINYGIQNKDLRMSKYFTLKKDIMKFEVHDCGDFDG